ncbi:hypothetical protein R1flu_015704 [Riccia fluitans]|uniref:Uncharacterized protein n=1 Tax=Riccia fluitans TaxID=41844 RepID=A0ABD1YJX2_9MARC
MNRSRAWYCRGTALSAGPYANCGADRLVLDVIGYFQGFDQVLERRCFQQAHFVRSPSGESSPNFGAKFGWILAYHSR